MLKSQLQAFGSSLGLKVLIACSAFGNLTAVVYTSSKGTLIEASNFYSALIIDHLKSSKLSQPNASYLSTSFSEVTILILEPREGR